MRKVCLPSIAHGVLISSFVLSSVVVLAGEQPLLAQPHLYKCDDILRTFTMVGSAKNYGHIDGPKDSALFGSRMGLAADVDGNIFVADEGGNSIRKISVAGDVTTLAGNGELGSQDGISSTAKFEFPAALALDKSGAIYVADRFNSSIRKVVLNEVTTFAGGQRGETVKAANGKEYSIAITGWADGKGSQATFYYPGGIAVDDHGNVYVADSRSNMLRRITEDGVVTTIAGKEPGAQYVATGYVDGPAMQAKLNDPSNIVVDHAGNLYFSDANHAIRKMSSEGIVTTIAGGGTARFTLNQLFPDSRLLFPKGALRDGRGAEAEFTGIVGMSINDDGNILVAQVWPSAIRLVTPSGDVKTLLGPSENCKLGQFIDPTQVSDQISGVTWLPNGRIAFSIGAVVMVEK